MNFISMTIVCFKVNTLFSTVFPSHLSDGTTSLMVPSRQGATVFINSSVMSFRPFVEKSELREINLPIAAE